MATTAFNRTAGTNTALIPQKWSKQDYKWHIGQRDNPDRQEFPKRAG
jgi:hypothetical protein